MGRKLSIIVTLSLIAVSSVLLYFTISRSSTIIYDSQNYYKHRVLLIVLDAFRHDYLERLEERNLELPNIRKMMNNGSRVMKMVPTFPSDTLPNHQTLITGLHSPYHGITYNTFNDSSFDYDRFSMSNQSSLNDNRWYKGYPDPIWVSCEKLPNCKSGSMLWPHTDAFINGHRPSRNVGQYFLLNEKPHVYPYDRRVDEMINWMKDDLIDFGMLYFDEPDAESHKYGPLHENTLNKLIEMDGWIGRLLDGINKAGLTDSVDILLTGDHGMTELSQGRIINIDLYVPHNLYTSESLYPVGLIYPVQGYEKKVYNLFKKSSSHLKVFWRHEIPEEYNYKDNPNRISPIVTIVDLGWVVNGTHSVFPKKRGNHGYFQNENDMKSTLLAMGPSFKNLIIESANHVDLYPLVMHLLGLKPNPNNGSFDALSGIMKDSSQTFKPRENRWYFDKFVILIILILIAYLIDNCLHLVFLVYNSVGKLLSNNHMKPDCMTYYDSER